MPASGEVVMVPRGTVLVADDDRAIVELIVEALTDEGYAASGVYDGAAAIAAILAHPPDLALIDLLFGSMSGLDVIRAVRANGIDIPLVIITANTPQAETLEAQGATTCLFKPFDLDDLLACIARYIRTDSSPSRGVDNALPAS
jgi:DNA-binding response OmpR family regulator